MSNFLESEFNAEEYLNKNIVVEAREERIKYNNKYGSLTLVRTEDYTYVGDMSSKDIKDEDYFISIEEAEQVALITDNKGIQIAFDPNSKYKKAYVVHHKNSSTAAFVKVEDLRYTNNKSAQDQIALVHKYGDNNL